MIGPGVSMGQSGQMAGLAEARRAGVPWRRAAAGDAWTIDGVDFRVLSPPGPPNTPDPDAPNDWSVVLQVTWGDFSALLMGDADAAIESRVPGGRVTLLKVGHHGSITSSAESFVDRVRPEYALISVGARNRYGHPDPAVLGRLSAPARASSAPTSGARSCWRPARTERSGSGPRGSGLPPATARATLNGHAKQGRHHRSPHPRPGAAAPGRHRALLRASVRYRAGRQDHLARGQHGRAHRRARPHRRRQRAGRGRAEARRLRPGGHRQGDGPRRAPVLHGLRRRGGDHPDPERFDIGPYVLLFDPLDGSSNINVNVSIGTIFSVHHRRLAAGRPGTMEDCLQSGWEQLAAGYVIYGSSTMLVYTTGARRGAHGFTLDPRSANSCSANPDIRIPRAPANVYSVNGPTTRAGRGASSAWSTFPRRERRRRSHRRGRFSSRATSARLCRIFIVPCFREESSCILLTPALRRAS